MASNFGSFESSTIITSFVTANWFLFGVTLNEFSSKQTVERQSFIADKLSDNCETVPWVSEK